MKRLFGSTAQAQTPTSDALTRSDTHNSSGPGAASSAGPHRAPLYQHTSYGAPSSASHNGGGVGGYPYTPSASSTNQLDYFPPTLALSPVNSRRNGSSPFLAPPRSPSAQGMASHSSPLTPMQYLAPQLTGQQPQAMAVAQPGTTPVIADPTSSLTNMQAHAVDRSELHKGVKSLEGVLVTFDEYRELKAKLAKCEKKLAKGLDDLGKAKAMEEVPSQTLQAASDIFEARMEVSTKQAKLIQKEYEAINEHCAKYFKRIAKEEKAFDEQLDMLDSKIKKAHASHDKNVKKGASRNAIESHDKFIQSIQALTADVARLKTAHSSSVGQRTFLTSLTVAATMGGLADAEYKALCESVRKSGQHIGKLNEWLNLTTNDAMAKAQPVDLSDDACAGLAQRIAVKEGEIREEWKRQEQARLKRLKEEHAMLALQQLGWTPPSEPAPKAPSPLREERVATPSREEAPTRTLANLPKLDSHGNLVDIEDGKKAKGEEASRKRETFEATAKNAGRESGHHQQESSMEGTVIIREAALADRSPDLSRKITIVARPNTDTSRSPSSALAQQHSDDSNTSSASNVSASASNSSATSKDSEDSTHLHPEPKSAGPLTPIEEKADDDVLVRGSDGDRGSDGLNNDSMTYLQRAITIKESPLEAEKTRFAEPAARRPSIALQPKQDSLRRDAVGGPRGNNQQSPPLTSLQHAPSNAGRATPDSPPQQRREEHEKQRSLWEREHERERQAELVRRLAEAEDRLRTLDRPVHAALNTRPPIANARTFDDPYDRGGATSDSGYAREGQSGNRKRYSEPIRQQATALLHRDEDVPATRYEPDRYAPAVGTSRLSSAGVTRSLSTDSERSFVARMKAVYQAERSEKPSGPQYDAGPSQRRRGAPELERFPSETRRVSDMALAYTSATGAGRGGHYESSTVPAAGSRSRYDSAPAQVRPTAAPAERYGAASDVRSDTKREPVTARRGGGEQPHASSCGCWNCSARHYRTAAAPTQGASISMATTKGGQLPPQPPPRHPSAAAAGHAAPPPNYRRQTMAVPPSDGAAHESSSYNGGSKARLSAPHDEDRHAVYARRSFEDEPGRRVVFDNKAYGTLR